MKKKKTIRIHLPIKGANSVFYFLGITLASISMMIMMTDMSFAADANTGSIDGFVSFLLVWGGRLGGLVALVGGIMFALGFKDNDPGQKTQGLQTLVAGFMIVGLCLGAPAIFGV